jgi:hypothetical protein
VVELALDALLRASLSKPDRYNHRGARAWDDSASNFFKRKGEFPAEVPFARVLLLASASLRNKSATLTERKSARRELLVRYTLTGALYDDRGISGIDAVGAENGAYIRNPL